LICLDFRRDKQKLRHFVAQLRQHLVVAQRSGDGNEATCRLPAPSAQHALIFHTRSQFLAPISSFEALMA
jgi:hypothetical protein